ADGLDGIRSTQPWTLVSGTRSVIPLWSRTNPQINEAFGLPSRERAQPEEEQERWRTAFWPKLQQRIREVEPGWRAQCLLIDADWRSLPRGNELRDIALQTAWHQSRPLRERGATLECKDSALSTIVRIANGTAIGYSPRLDNFMAGPLAQHQR